MKSRTVVLLAVLSALWISGLLSQLHSMDAAMRYLALSLAIAAVAIWLTPARPLARRKFRDRKSPPDRR
jgi:branched-subunit amino acid transport protein